MSATAYYNEIDPYAAQWLRNLISAGLIAPGDVDERSIIDVRPDDLIGYTQCHFFAGIGGWSYAARLAGWPDDQPLWTGSCPCQPFSKAGKLAGFQDARHLWPSWFGLIRECRPPVVFGEQVPVAIKHGWLDLVAAELESATYAFSASLLSACEFGAPFDGQRIYFTAEASGAGMARFVKGKNPRRTGQWQWTGEADLLALARTPFEPGDRWPNPLFRSVDARIPGRVGQMRAYGNAIVPQVAAKVIGAYMDCTP